jgi:hypothetical protein
MKTKRWASIGISVLIVGLLAVGSSYAGTVMPVKGPIKAPYEHTKNTVEFTHQKHVADYKINCGECHHDADNKPLTNLKEGDEVQTCFECHSTPGELKGKKAKGKSKKELLAYHGNALHGNCIPCHKDYNKKMKKKLAPQTCTACHPK